MRNKIVKVANRVRAKLETFATTGAMRASPHLGGLCLYGSIMLYDALNEIGLKTEVAQGQGHYFAICEGFLVDVTASQFGQPKVVVRNYNKVKEGIKYERYVMNWWRAAKVGSPEYVGSSSYYNRGIKLAEQELKDRKKRGKKYRAQEKW